MIALWGFLIKRPKIGLGNGFISSLDKEVRRRCISRGRRKLYGYRGIWGGWRIIWGGISSKSVWCGIDCLGVCLMRTDWVWRGRYKCITKEEIIDDAGSGWASWYISLSWGVAKVSSNRSEKLSLWGTCPYWINWLARTSCTGLIGRRGQTGRDEGRAGGSTVARDRLGAPPLNLEICRAAGSGGFHQFHWCCRGHIIFVSV